MPGDLELMNRLRRAAQIVVDDAKRRSAEWSVRTPPSIHLIGGSRRVDIVAGGRAAPMAYTMEGRANGAPIAHPVFGRPDRLRSEWTWVKQPPRPFLREAIDATQDELLKEFARVIDDWAHERGFR